MGGIVVPVVCGRFCAHVFHKIRELENHQYLADSDLYHCASYQPAAVDCTHSFNTSASSTRINRVQLVNMSGSASLC